MRAGLRDRFSRWRGQLVRDRIVGSALLLCALVPLVALLHAGSNSGVVYSGVTAGSTELGGMTESEALTAVRERAAGVGQEIRLQGAEQEPVTVDASNFGVVSDPEATVERAYAIGREGSLSGRVTDRVRVLLGGMEVAPVVSFDEAALDREVAGLSERLDRGPQDAAVRIEGSEVSLSEARPGFELDEEPTRQSIAGAVVGLSPEAELFGEESEPEISTAEAESVAEDARRAVSEPAAFVAGEDGEERWELSAAEVGESLAVVASERGLELVVEEAALRERLTPAYESLEDRAVEAGFRFEGEEIAVTESRPGREIDTAALIWELENGLPSGESEYELPLVADRPELTTGEAQEQRPTTVLGEYATDYTWDEDPGRRVNMRQASEAISGAVIAPGKAFSYNEYADSLEYEDAKVIVEGSSEYAEGGGLSQVSSTLYMAANLAGLEVLEATPHMAELPYIQPGLDTTVWFGAIDLSFRNNTDGYMMIRTWMGEDGYHHVRIYGPETGKEVTVDSELVYEGTDDEDRRVTTWAAYKTITRGNEVLFDDEFRRVTYRSLTP